MLVTIYQAFVRGWFRSDRLLTQREVAKSGQAVLPKLAVLEQNTSCGCIGCADSPLLSR